MAFLSASTGLVGGVSSAVLVCVLPSNADVDVVALQPAVVLLIFSSSIVVVVDVELHNALPLTLGQHIGPSLSQHISPQHSAPAGHSPNVPPGTAQQRDIDVSKHTSPYTSVPVEQQPRAMVLLTRGVCTHVWVKGQMLRLEGQHWCVVGG
jgi:hypothetical protein